ncbi:hypothetical protein E2562_022928 [Oryza meyeriana var. granulata]|uniref:RING-type E3 ubiquitin transferase n=1 Tax=Oryza meyeriana var. granulata TaxID=110450 RepID=A0A6G1D6R1_9ORYZ|nr:hypothetical protein E2562_022928 [Oryza meyeriana var. granulata]
MSLPGNVEAAGQLVSTIKLSTGWVQEMLDTLAAYGPHFLEAVENVRMSITRVTGVQYGCNYGAMVQQRRQAGTEAVPSLGRLDGDGRGSERYRGGAPPAEGGVAARLWLLFGGGGREGGDGSAGAWCYEGGLDEASMAKLPCREVGKGEEAMDCAVCITELAAGETARVLPRCGHGFHVACVDMWLKSHSTCPLCRCPAVDEPPAAPPPVQAPEADPESPNFPTNVLFFGSQDEVSTGGAQAQPQHLSPAMTTTPPSPAAGVVAGAVVDAARVRGLRRLLGCGGASPPPPPRQHDNVDRDIEMGLAGGETSSPAKSPHPSS